MAHHDPTAAIAPASATSRELQQEYGGRWDIAFQQDLRIWSAERRSPDGRQRRFIGEHTPAGLAGKLAAAETAH